MAFVTMSMPFIYNWIMLANGGATFGKKILKIKVVRENGGPLGYGMAFSRSLLEGVCLSAAIGMSALIYFILNLTIIVRGNYEPEQGLPKTQFLFLPVFLLSLAPYFVAFFLPRKRALHDYLFVRTLVIKTRNKTAADEQPA
jgi:uncharacterized RDD family membrane protein YckC